MFYLKISSFFCLINLIVLVSFLIFSNIAASAQNSLNNTDTTYRILPISMLNGENTIFKKQ